MRKSRIKKWFPSILVMAAIFAFSTIPSREMPYFSWVDFLVKKGGHMLGYGLLGLTYWYGMRFEKRRGWLAMLLVVFYAATDEFHQLFVPGRHATLVDVGIDSLGAAIALVVYASYYREQNENRWR